MMNTDQFCSTIFFDNLTSRTEPYTSIADLKLNVLSCFSNSNRVNREFIVKEWPIEFKST